MLLVLNIFFFLTNCVLFGIFLYKLNHMVKIDEETREQNIELREKQKMLEGQILNNQKDITQQMKNLDSLVKQTNTVKKELENSANEVYEKSLEVASEKMQNAAEKMSKEYQKAEEEAQEEYLKTMFESVATYQDYVKEQKLAAENIDYDIRRLQKTFNAAMEAAKRLESTLFQTDFYRIQLTPIDVDEIKRLREVEPFLRDPEPLNKVIYKVYYEIPTNDLIGRVLGSDLICGIYKITHIDSKRCYVGQSVNVAERWKQHIKRGIGAEQITRNKLYPAMQKYGVENFTFELIESCPREQLDEREDYWQEFFGAKEFGYSIK